MVWAGPVVLEALREHPPEALVNEVRVALVARSFRVCWWLFCEEVRTPSATHSPAICTTGIGRESIACRLSNALNLSKRAQIRVHNFSWTC